MPKKNVGVGAGQESLSGGSFNAGSWNLRSVRREVKEDESQNSGNGNVLRFLGVNKLLNK